MNNWAAHSLKGGSFRMIVEMCLPDMRLLIIGLLKMTVVGLMLLIMYVINLANELESPRPIIQDDVKLSGHETVKPPRGIRMKFASGR